MYPRGNGGNGGPRGPPMQSNTNANNVTYGGSMGQQPQQGYAQANQGRGGNPAQQYGSAGTVQPSMGNANAVGGGSQYPTANAPTMNNAGAPASMTSSWDSYFNQSNVSSMGQMTGNQAPMGQQHQGGMNPNQNANA
eukprot:gene16705-11958_t